MSQFLINRAGCFFEIRSPINNAELVDVTVYPTRQAMMKAVSEQTGESLDDLENCSILVRGEEGDYEECDHRGIWSDIDLEGASLEQWINNYEV
jgi:hypothetical protein